MALCLVAMFAITASVAASASATPRFYSSSNTCTKKFGILAEKGECIINGVPNKTQEIAFSETGSEALLKGALKITCVSKTGKGKIFNEGGRAKIKKLKLVYSDCKKTGTTTPCGSKFVTVEGKEQNTGKINTEAIKGDITRGSEKSGGTLAVVENLTGEKGETKGFTTFYCGKEKVGSIKVIVKGHILTGRAGVLAAPDETKLSTKGETFNKQQAGVTGCQEAAGFSQQYLFVEGTGPCQFLKVTENGTELEPSVNVDSNEVKFGTKKIELVE